MINLERRAEIGAERRARSRNAILVAAFALYGTEQGQNTRIEDICREAGVARGTFYNHFPDLDHLKQELLDELTREFDHAMHLMFDRLESPAEQCAAAVRYYIRAAKLNREWGWAMINSGTRGQIFGKVVWQNSLQTIGEAIENGEFRQPNAELARDFLLGAVLAGVMSVIRDTPDPNYPEAMAECVLLASGVAAGRARELAYRPLPALPPIAHEMIVIASMPSLDDIAG